VDTVATVNAGVDFSCRFRLFPQEGTTLQPPSSFCSCDCGCVVCVVVNCVVCVVCVVCVNCVVCVVCIVCIVCDCELVVSCRCGQYRFP
jgi:hypothetical protein